MNNESRKKPYLDGDNAKFPMLIQVAPATSTSSPIWQPSYAPDGLPALEFSSLSEMFDASVARHGDKPCLGWRPLDDAGVALDYNYMTYKEVSTWLRGWQCNLVDKTHEAFAFCLRFRLELWWMLWEPR